MPRKKELPIPLPEPKMDFVMTTGQGMKGKTIKLNGKPVTAEQLSQLKGEASQFKNMLLYQVLIETLRWEGREVIFNKAENFQDVLNGKTILHTIGTQENIIKLLE